MTNLVPVRTLTTAEFEAIAEAAVNSVSLLEGWCSDEHKAAKIAASETQYEPSPALRKELRRQLRQRGFRLSHL